MRLRRSLPAVSTAALTVAVLGASPAAGGVPCGVFSWRPPAALVTDLSRLLDEGAA